MSRNIDFSTCRLQWYHIVVGPDMIRKRTIVTRALNPSWILLQMLLTIHSGFLKQKEVVVSVKMFPLWWLIIGHHQLSSVTFLPLSHYYRAVQWLLLLWQYSWYFAGQFEFGMKNWNGALAATAALCSLYDWLNCKWSEKFMEATDVNCRFPMEALNAYNITLAALSQEREKYLWIYFHGRSCC